MNKFITQSEEEYLNHFGEFMLRWTKGVVDLTIGKPIENSWIAKGGFKVTSVGRTLVDKGLSRKLDEIKLTLIYIGFQNLSDCVPTLEQISSRLFKGDFNKTLAMLNTLVKANAVQFLEENPKH